MAAAAVDVSYVAASYSLPETSLQTLLSEPTIELVQSLLTQIEARAREHDDLKSDKLRAEVELEAAVHSADSRARASKAAAEKAASETDELRQKLAQEESARQQTENELHTLKTSANNSTSEVQTLQSRIKTLEAQNRDTIALHDAKSAAHDRLAEELAAQHQKFVEQRKRVADLEESNQSLQNASTNVKYREQNFEQEIALLRKNVEWYESELATRQADYTKQRKEKNAQVAELQRANADASQTIDSLRRTEASQRQRIEELEQKVENSLSRIQHLQEEAVQNQESLRAELDNARRLAALHQESANTVKTRLQDVQAQLTNVNDTAAYEVGQLQAELESKHNKLTVNEGRIGELEALVENLEGQISELRSTAQAPATPRRALNGSFDTPGRAGSPFTPGASRTKGNMSITQLYAENTQLKAQVRSLQEQNESRQTAFDEMIQVLDGKMPEIAELHQQNEHLTAEVSNMSSLLEDATSEREAARKESRKYQGEIEGLRQQKILDQKQLEDLSVQLKLLLCMRTAQEEGLGPLSQADQELLTAAANNEIPDSQLPDSSATDRLISKHLLLYKNINELQTQNAQLTRTIREVAETYEGAEAMEKAGEHERVRKAYEALQEEVSHFKEQINSLDLRAQAFMKERDMYRRIATSRGHHQSGSDAAALFDQSLGAAATPSPGRATPSVEQTPHSKEVAGYEKLIKDLQSHLDVLREESATDRSSLRQQVDHLVKENHQLQGEKMRLSTARDNLQERFDMVQSRINQLQSEKAEVQKRCDSLQDTFAEHDVRTQQVAEELVEAKSQVDSLQRENTNLKSSQTVWKTIEERITSENKNLTEQRDQYSRMITDMHKMRNESELSEAQNRRQLQDRANALEAELQIAKRKLEEEIEDHKKESLRRDYEQTESRKRIDDLAQASTEARMEVASLKATKDQLQERIQELQADLRSAQDQVQALQPRATPRASGPIEPDETQNEEAVAQVLDLQRKLERKQEELDNAKADIETYKQLAQQFEDDLRGYMESSEQNEEERNRKDAEKDATITDLQQRVEEISSELATTNTELSSLRGQHEQELLQLNQQKELLEGEVSGLKEDIVQYKAQCEEDKQLTASQAEIAKRAQQDYENELAKHGVTMKSLKEIREERNTLKTEMTQYKVQAEAASSSLTQSEEQWSTTRERLEREIADARKRYNEMNDHNRKLLQQFEGQQAQIASLKNSRMTVAAGDADAATFDGDKSGLEEIVTYLRQEKDILEVQFSMKDQEVKRLEHQYAHAQSQLDHAREKLLAEQSQSQQAQGSTSLQALHESIEQLNVYRESATTLRTQLRRAETQLTEKTKEAEDLYNQIQPLQDRISQLEGELELNAGHLKNVEEDRDRWQKRHSDVLQRYDRIDPQELEDLKTRLAELQAERDQAVQQSSGTDERVQAVKVEFEAELEKSKTEFIERKDKMVTDFKARMRDQKEKNTELMTANTTITAERDGLQQQLATIQQELDATRLARDEAIAHASANANAKPDVTMGEEGQVDEDASGLTQQQAQDLEARASAADNRANEEANRSVALHIQVQALQENVERLEGQAGELQQRIAGLNAELSDIRSQKAQAQARVQELEANLASSEHPTSTSSSEDVEKLKEELSAAQKEVEDLRTRADMAQSSVDASKENGTTEKVINTTSDLDERESGLVSREEDLSKREAEFEDAKAKQEASTKQKLENMKTKCNDMITKRRTEHTQQMEQLASEHAAEIERIRQEQQTAKEAVAPPAADDTTSSEAQVKTEALPGSESSDQEIKDWIHRNPVALGIMKRNLRNTVASEMAKVKEEQEQTTLRKVEEATAKLKEEQDEVVGRKLEEATAKAKEEHEGVMSRKVAEARELAEKKSAAKISMQTNKFNRAKLQLDEVNAKWAVVETAAQERPETPVKTVYEEAKDAKPAAAANPPTPSQGLSAQSPAQLAQSTPGQAPSSPAHQTGQSQPASSGQSQTNGPQANPFAHNAGSPQNPFQSMAQGSPLQQGNFNPMGNQMNQGFGGFNGMQQPGFGAPHNQQHFGQNNARPNSPFNQQPQQQGGRGGPNAGTGIQALQQIRQQGNQSGIPRGGGGTGIPRPGGGGGRGGGPQQQNQNPNTQSGGNMGGSQIGRGGGRGGGGRGGRGGQIQTNIPGQPQSHGTGSPGGGRGNLNPNAQQFQPGGGRGQKRGPDDMTGGDGNEGAHRGGKRARGRGGGGHHGGGGGNE